VLPDAFGYGLCQIHGFKCAPNVLKKQPCFFNSIYDIKGSFSLSATSIRFRAEVRLIKKFGSFKTKSGTVQHFRCLNTAYGKTFIEQRRFIGVYLDASKIIQIVRCLTEGCGVRATTRLCGCDKNTVLQVVNTIGEKCERFHDEIVRQSKPNQSNWTNFGRVSGFARAA
jgi:transposase-like protein